MTSVVQKGLTYGTVMEPKSISELLDIFRSTDKAVFIDFMQPGCGPCIKFGRDTFDPLSKKTNNNIFVRLNVVLNEPINRFWKMCGGKGTPQYGVVHRGILIRFGGVDRFESAVEMLKD